jgi:transposase-like protein
MTYSEETRQTIIRMKEAGATFRMIGLAINKSREAVKKWWQRNHDAWGQEPTEGAASWDV